MTRRRKRRKRRQRKRKAREMPNHRTRGPGSATGLGSERRAGRYAGDRSYRADVKNAQTTQPDPNIFDPSESHLPTDTDGQYALSKTSQVGNPRERERVSVQKGTCLFYSLTYSLLIPPSPPEQEIPNSRLIKFSQYQIARRTLSGLHISPISILSGGPSLSTSEESHLIRDDPGLRESC